MPVCRAQVGMWHEARKQERKIRGLMVDYRRRADRRREFYQKTRADPTQFLRIYGRPYKIHLDPAVALAAESPQSMMPWQGDIDNMIDRFDVRAHLDIIPEPKDRLSEAEEPKSREDTEEESKVNYERYRTLVQNECSGFTEEQCLVQIHIEEQYGSSATTKASEEEKKKLADKRVAIAYTYEDSTEPTLGEEEKKEEEEGVGSDDESDISVDEMDLDVVIDVDTLTDEQRELMNSCGTTFAMTHGDFISLLELDKEDAELLRQAKILEEEKAQFSGRKSRRERRAFKERQMKGKNLSPPSYAARDSPKYEPFRKSSSSRSRSRSPETSGRVKFITSFGGDSSDDEHCNGAQGPALPPHLRVNSESKPSSRSV